MPEEIIKKAYLLYPELLTYNEIGELCDSNASIRRAYIQGFTDALEFAATAIKEQRNDSHN